MGDHKINVKLKDDHFGRLFIISYILYRLLNTDYFIYLNDLISYFAQWFPSPGSCGKPWAILNQTTLKGGFYLIIIPNIY